MSRGELEHLNKIAKNYNSAKTATVRGVRSAYSKAYKSFVKNAKKSGYFDKDTSLSYDEWKEIVEHENFEENLLKFGSDTVLKVVKEYDVDTALQAMSESSDLSTINSFNRLAKQIAKDSGKNQTE